MKAFFIRFLWNDYGNLIDQIYVSLFIKGNQCHVSGYATRSDLY